MSFYTHYKYKGAHQYVGVYVLKVCSFERALTAIYVLMCYQTTLSLDALLHMLQA